MADKKTSDETAAAALDGSELVRVVQGGVSVRTVAQQIADLANAYADALVTGLWDDRGTHDASGNTYPSSGGSGSAGAILKGDIWTISVAGTLGGLAVAPGDTVRALVNTPGSTDANWAIGENNIGYVPENAANKGASGGYAGLTLFKLNLRNAANSFTSFLTNAATAARTWTMPDKDGTVAMLDDIAIAAHLVNPQTGTSYTYLDGDRGKLVTHSNAAAIAGTLPQAGASSTFVAGWFVDVQNRGAGTLTITPTTSTIDGAATLVLTTGQGVRLFSDGTNYFTQRGAGTASTTSPVLIQVAASDETTALTTGTKVTFRAPYAFTLSSVRASLTTAQSAGSIFTVNVKKNGTTIFSTLLTIDNTEKTTTTAATPAVLSTTAIADDDEITISIDQVGTSGALGLKVSLIGTKP